MSKRKRIVDILITTFAVLCWIPVFFIFFYYCTMRTNDFCFDYKKKEVYTEGFSIHYMSIEKKYGGYIVWHIKDYTNALEKINLNDYAMRGYEVNKQGLVFTSDNDFFPNTCYRIVIGGGDSGESILSFCTDSIGVPIADKEHICLGE